MERKIEVVRTCPPTARSAARPVCGSKSTRTQPWEVEEIEGVEFCRPCEVALEAHHLERNEDGSWPVMQLEKENE